MEKEKQTDVVSKTAEKDDTNKKPAAKLKSGTVKDVISKGRAMTGSPASQININPIQEAAKKESTAVMAFGRFNPPTVGHEKLIHKVEQVASEHEGTAHIIGSKTHGDANNPLPPQHKTNFLKKIAQPSTEVSAASPQHPTLLHQAAMLHSQGHQHLVMVAGSDRVKEYETLLNKYNGAQGKHGHYNFKTIKVVSAGQRDPDAEGVEGISGTEARKRARSGNIKSFKQALPTALHPHAQEIADMIKQTKESIDLDFENFIVEQEINEISMTARMKKAQAMRRYKNKIEAAKKRALARRASGRTIVKRAKREAINKMKRKLSGGRDPHSLPPAEKARVEDIIRRRKKAVNRLAMRLVPQMRKIENKRFSKESFDIEVLDEMFLSISKEVSTITESGIDNLIDKSITSGISFDSLKETYDAAYATYMIGPREGMTAQQFAFNAVNNFVAEASKGLWHNIHAKRERIKSGSGEHMRKPGSKGAPTKQDLIRSQNEEVEQLDELSPQLVGKVNKARLDKPAKSVAADKARSIAVKKAFIGSKNSPSNREQGTNSLTKIYKGDTPGQHKEDLDLAFGEAFKATDREAVMRSGQDRKKEDLVARSGQDRKQTTNAYRQQEIEKKIIDEKYGKGYKSPWDRIEKAKPGIGARIDSHAKELDDLHKKYQSIVDKEKNDKKSQNEDIDLDSDLFIEEDFISTGLELYEDWGELSEEAEKNGRKVKLGKPFLTPGGPKKRSVYVKNESGNVVKVNFGDPNMTIKKNDPERRRSFRARHNCENPGPRTKARYWSCKAW